MTATIHVLPRTRRILLADGDAGVRALLCAYLGRNGFRTEAVASLAALVARVKAVRYDLVVVDLAVSRERGAAFADWVRRDDAPPVILLSAFGAEVDRAAARWIGGDRILAKPCEPAALLSRVRAVLRAHAALTS